MVKTVQRVGGPASNQDILVSADRDITVTTDTHELRLHDAIKVGGYRFLNILANDIRYQLTNAELTAIAALTNQTGMLVRKGTGNYIYRTITAGTDIDVTNGSGVGGNPVISLPSTITQALSFLGLATFSNGIAGELAGSLTGNVVGDVVGDTTGTHTGAVVGNVTGNLTGNQVGASVGDVDVRGKTLLLDDGQIPISKLASVPVLVNDTSYLIPAGMIQLWFGAIGAIPSGWVLCDGTNSTPDLRDKFVSGAGGTKSPGDTFGASTHDHGVINASTEPDHQHTVSVDPHTLTIAQIPNFQVGAGIGLSADDASVAIHGTQAVGVNPATDNLDKGGSNPTLETLTEPIGGGTSHPHTGSSGNAGSHLHTVNTVPNAASNLPPAHALAYIMKT